MYQTFGSYFAGSLLVAVLNGLVVLTIGLVLGVPLAPIAGLWAMLTNFIPQIGGFLGGSFFVLLALTESPLTALIAGVVFFGVPAAREQRDRTGHRRRRREPRRRRPRCWPRSSAARRPECRAHSWRRRSSAPPRRSTSIGAVSCLRREPACAARSGDGSSASGGGHQPHDWLGVRRSGSARLAEDGSLGGRRGSADRTVVPDAGRRSSELSRRRRGPAPWPRRWTDRARSHPGGGSATRRPGRSARRHAPRPPAPCRARRRRPRGPPGRSSTLDRHRDRRLGCVHDARCRAGWPRPGAARPRRRTTTCSRGVVERDRAVGGGGERVTDRIRRTAATRSTAAELWTVGPRRVAPAAAGPRRATPCARPPARCGASPPTARSSASRAPVRYISA